MTFTGKCVTFSFLPLGFCSFCFSSWWFLAQRCMPAWNCLDFTMRWGITLTTQICNLRLLIRGNNHVRSKDYCAFAINVWNDLWAYLLSDIQIWKWTKNHQRQIYIYIEKWNKQSHSVIFVIVCCNIACTACSSWQFASVDELQTLCILIKDRVKVKFRKDKPIWMYASISFSLYCIIR